jgi:hypothetical protein
MFSTEELQEIKLFLGLLYPWDEAGETLFKSVSWTFVGKEGELTFANYAAQRLDDLIRLIQTRARRGGANVYVALGTQRTALIEAVSNDGFPKAKRVKANIVSFNSVALDIDVKAGGYATTEDAFTALDDFVRVTGLPIPTMEVLSGSGGVHVYWCFNNPVPQPEWLQIAVALQQAALGYKLKFDPAVTVNPAGILRVPNTFNHKSNPPTKVRLNREEGHTFPRYDYQQMASALSQWTGAAHVKAGKQGPGANHKRTQNFTDNVGSAPPVTIDELAVNCMTIDDILDRGGDGDQEPLWNLALYAASFTSDPHDAAHRLSNQDPRYSYDSTEKKLLEKISARTANPDAGWPTCKSFAAQSPKCALCPLFAQDKTPFHHVIPDALAQSYATEPPPMPGTDPLMPPDFWRNKFNHVLTTAYKKNGESYTVAAVPYPILDGGIDPATGELCYQATVAGVDHWRIIDVSMAMQPITAAQALSRGLNGVFIPAKYHTSARDFLVAWVKHLQSIGRSRNQSSYGWNGQAFAFDDKIYHETRVETVYRGKHHDKSFAVVGELKPWQDAVELVYGNMPLETVVASAFAAPLVELIASSSLVMSCYSQHSGIGKSTAMMLAQSVWGNPRTGMSTLADTTNSMMKKIGDLKSLPIYWDELRTKGQLEKVIEIVFQVTQGKGKARLNKDITQADAPIFTTMFVVASNHGIVDTVYSQTESTEAGGLRVFEIEPQPLKTVTPNADQLVIGLGSNYGVAGAQFAEWLAANRKQAVATLKFVGEKLDEKHKFQAKERFWRMTMTTLLVGAALANHIGLTKFDVVALDQFLGDMLARQRGEMKAQEYATMSATQDVVGLLQEMISDQRGKSLIVTETIPYPRAGGGRPVPSNLVDTDLSRLGDIWLQVGDQDGRVRARLRPFKEWMRKRQLNPKTIIDALRGRYVVTQSKQTIGAGVPGLDASTRIGQTECLDLTPLPSASSPNHGSDALN